MVQTASALLPAAPRREMQRFDEVRDIVEANAQGQWDVEVRRKDVTVKDGAIAFPLDTLGEHWESLSPTSWAQAQLCMRLGIPVGYFRKCPSVLQDIQANYWIKSLEQPGSGNGRSNGHDSDDGFDFIRPQVEEVAERPSPNPIQERWLLRARRGTLRAVLSERYSPLDHTELMATLAPLLEDQYRVDWFAWSEESLHLRVIDPARTREVLPDDALSVGIHITNSEVGKRSITVDALVYRLVCSNGLIRLVKGKSLLQKRHIHLSRPRLRAALEEALHGALATADDFVEQLRRTAQQPLSDVDDVLEVLGERWRLSQNTQEAVKASMRREPAAVQETLYGLVNGLTRAAQGLPDDDRYDLEVLAGQLAEKGVPAYARSRIERAEVPSVETESESEDEEQVAAPEAEAPSIIQLAQEMFQADVVGSSNSIHGNGHREVVRT